MTEKIQIGSQTFVSDGGAEQEISRDDSRPITEIDRETLRGRLARGDDFALVMASHDWAFRAKHIPTSIHFKNDQEAFAGLGHDDDIVVYCSNVDCNASLALLKKLRDLGYRRLAHYSGGLIDWEDAGLPLEGDWANGG